MTTIRKLRNLLPLPKWKERKESESVIFFPLLYVYVYCSIRKRRLINAINAETIENRRQRICQISERDWKRYFVFRRSLFFVLFLLFFRVVLVFGLRVVVLVLILVLRVNLVVLFVLRVVLVLAFSCSLSLSFRVLSLCLSVFSLCLFVYFVISIIMPKGVVNLIILTIVIIMIILVIIVITVTVINLTDLKWSSISKQLISNL